MSNLAPRIRALALAWLLVLATALPPVAAARRAVGGQPGGTAAAPTNVELLLQGQTTQGSGSYVGGGGSPNDGFQPASPNSNTFGWLSVAGASSYNIYRSVSKGAYSYYANVTDSAASTNYSTYVSNSGSNPHLGTIIDRAYTDSSASNSVGYPVGSGPAYFSNAVGYNYEVTAIVGGVESAMSVPMVAPLYIYGTRVLLLDAFNQPPNYASTTGGTTPSGSSVTMEFDAATEGATYTNPYVGYGATEWNLNIAAYNYMVFVVKANKAGVNFTITPEIVGDYTLKLLSTSGGGNLSSSSYGGIGNGIYTTIKIPVSDLFTDYTSGSGVLQNAYYKTTIDCNDSSVIWYIDSWYFSTT